MKVIVYIDAAFAVYMRMEKAKAEERDKCF